MLTAPTEIMRNILLNNLPQNSVFIGDDLYQKKLECIKTILSKDLFDSTKNAISLLETNPPRIICDNSLWYLRFTIKNPNGTPLVSFHELTSTYQWMFAGLGVFRGSLTFPYVLVDLDALANVKKLANIK